MSHTRRASTFAALTSALVAAGCSAKPPELPKLSELSLSKLNPFGASEPLQAKPEAPTTLPGEYQSTVTINEPTAESPSAKRYVTRLFEGKQVQSAMAICNSENRSVGETYIVLMESEQRRNRAYVPAKLCEKAGATPAHNTQASSSAAFRAEDADRTL